MLAAAPNAASRTYWCAKLGVSYLHDTACPVFGPCIRQSICIPLLEPHARLGSDASLLLLRALMLLLQEWES